MLSRLVVAVATQKFSDKWFSTKDLLDLKNNFGNYTFLNVDLVNKENLYDAIKQAKPDVIMHLAAESHVDRSIHGPAEFIRTNIFGTFSLLQSAYNYYQSLSNINKSKFRFHHISTDEVYGDLGETNNLFKETTPYSPSSPYSASKASSDHLVRSWWQTYGLPVIISNCSNNYGPYQFPDLVKVAINPFYKWASFLNII